MERSTPVVRLERISKSFGPVRANHNITLSIHSGRIKALLGENGAGKSTLMSILAGKSQQDSGRILVDGKEVHFRSARDAFQAGIGMVYQHFMLVDAMTVAENLCLGQSTGLIHPKAMAERVEELAALYGLEVNPHARIADLSMGERQRVEILKLLYRNCRVLILDEPTAVLTPPEVEYLFKAMRRMATEGKALVFISHKMQEVLDIADEIDILRRGEIVDSFQRADVPDERELAGRMIGRQMMQVTRPPRETDHRENENFLLIENLEDEGLHNINFSIRKGEILAIVGVAGNGQKELVEVLAGLKKPRSGNVTLLGKPWAEFFSTSRKALTETRNTMVYIPEDRKGLATCPTLDLVDNFGLTNRFCFSSGPFMNWVATQTACDVTIEEYQVLPGDSKATASALSGGNLQKLVIGREFYRQPRLIIAENPTQGLDVAAMEEVWRRLLEAREDAAILLVTGDLTEALTLADTFAVMYRGNLTGPFPREDTKMMDDIGLLMAGVH